MRREHARAEASLELISSSCSPDSTVIMNVRQAVISLAQIFELFDVELSVQRKYTYCDKIR